MSKGIPPCTKPINSGTEQQEQKDVMEPKTEEKSILNRTFFLV